MPRRETWCEVCFNLSETFAAESGQAVYGGDLDNLPHLCWSGIGGKWYKIYGTFQLFKRSASSGCRFCKFLEGIMDEFVLDQSIDTDGIVIRLDEACLDVEIRHSNGDRRTTCFIYRPAGKKKSRDDCYLKTPNSLTQTFRS